MHHIYVVNVKTSCGTGRLDNESVNRDPLENKRATGATGSQQRATWIQLHGSQD